MSDAPRTATYPGAGPAPAPARRPERTTGWYLPIAVLLLLVAAFFRHNDLATNPPGMLHDELVNAQLSDRVREGDLSVIYEEVTPAREGLYYVLLSVSSMVTGRGLLLWRLPSVWLSLLSLAFTAQLIRRLLGVRIALMVLGLAAVAFWPVWMGRTVQHVALMPLATTLVLYLLVRAFTARRRPAASLWFTLGGVALGVAQYVHVTAWTLIVIVLAYILYRLLVNRPEIAGRWGNIFYTLTLTAVIVIPLAMYLISHPGVREPVPVAEQPNLLAEIPTRLVSALAALVLRGDMLPAHNLPGRPVLGPLLGALLIVGIGVSLARWRRPQYGLLLLWLAIGLLPSLFLPRQPDFEYMAVILPVVFAFPAIGLRVVFQFGRERFGGLFRRATLASVGLLVAALIAVNGLWTYRDFFLVWPELEDVRASYQADFADLARYLDTSTDPTPVSVCSVEAEPGAEPFALSNREMLGYLMHRHSLPIRYFDCTQSLVLANGGGDQRLIFPRGHYYDLPGPLLRWLQTAEPLAIEGVEPDVAVRLDVSDRLADYLGTFTTMPLVAWPPEARERGLAPLPLSFGYNAALLGYEIVPEALPAGQPLWLTSYWRMDGPPPPELTVFVHLLGNPVVIVAQHDTLGVEISTLQVRDVFIQNTMINTPPGLSPGLYTLSTGLYFQTPEDRAHAFVDGVPLADRLFLRSVLIEP